MLEPAEFAKNSLSSSEAVCLKSLFSLLDIAQVPYAVMRNYETLPYSSGVSDLDLLVRPENAAKAKALLLQAVKQGRGVSIGSIRTLGFFKVYTLGLPATQSQKWWGLCIDINDGLLFKGLRLLDDKAWGELTIRHNSVSVLSDGIAGILGVLKELLNNSQLPARYLPAAKLAATQDWERIQAALQPMGREALDLVHEIITSCKSNDDVTQRCCQLRTALLVHAVKNNPFVTLRQRFLAWWSKVQRYLSPSGTVIALLGVDGAGKSTVINTIKPVLDSATHNATFVHHLRPGLLPPLARLKGKNVATAGPTLDPHGSTPSGALGSLVRLSYLTLDYILGYWLLIRPKIAKQPAIVIFDRYAYDMALDPRRFRIGLPGWVAGLFAQLAPTPDLILCLHADPEIVAARKQELPLEETRRQKEALLAFARAQPTAVLISTEGSINEVRERVLGALFNFFARRTKKSLDPEALAKSTFVRNDGG